jgi:hypothetical protein
MEQMLFLSHWFQKVGILDVLKGAYWRKWVKGLFHIKKYLSLQKSSFISSPRVGKPLGDWSIEVPEMHKHRLYD